MFLLLFRHLVMSNSVTPSTAARQASLSFTVSQSLLKLMSIESIIPSNLILSHPFSSCPQSFPVSGSFPMSWLFKWPKYWRFGFSKSVLSMNIQDWFPLGWTGLISLFSKQLSNTTNWKYQFCGAQPSLWPLISIHDYWKNCSFYYTQLCWQSDVSAFYYAI